MTLVQRTEILMGNRFDIGVIGTEKKEAERAIDEAVIEIRRIEELLTTYKADSRTNQINRQAGLQPVEVEEEVFQLVERALRISSLTQGAFDLSYGSLDKSLWNFDQKMTQLPSKAEALQAVKLIDYRNIVLENGTVFLKEKGMRIGFGGIGKGYAADRAKQVLQALGYENGVVNASGDMNAWGVREDGQSWKVGISNPDSPKEIIAEFDLSNAAVATSGNYEKFVWIDGIKYSHTIHPKTGYPIRGIKSVTVFAPFAELADALTTPLAVMGVEVGLNLINQMTGVACLMINDDNVIYSSKGIRV